MAHSSRASSAAAPPRPRSGTSGSGSSHEGRASSTPTTRHPCVRRPSSGSSGRPFAGTKAMTGRTSSTSRPAPTAWTTRSCRAFTALSATRSATCPTPCSSPPPATTAHRRRVLPGCLRLGGRRRVPGPPGGVSNFSNYGRYADVYVLGRNHVNAFPDGRYVLQGDAGQGGLSVTSGTGWRAGAARRSPLRSSPGLIAAEVSADRWDDGHHGQDDILNGITLEEVRLRHGQAKAHPYGKIKRLRPNF